MTKNIPGWLACFVVCGVITASCASQAPSSVSTPVVTIYPTNPPKAQALWRDKPIYYPFDSQWTVNLYYDSATWELHFVDKPGTNNWIVNRQLTDCILIRASGKGLDSTQFRVEREIKKLGEVNFELNKVVRLQDRATISINYCTKDAPQNAATCYMAQSETSMALCQVQAEDVLATMKFTRQSSDK